MPSRRVLSLAELLRELGSRRAVDEALMAGSWQRVLCGAYVEGALPVDLESRAQAARMLLPAHGVICGGSALWLYGLDATPHRDDRLEVLVPRGRAYPRREGISARQGRLAPRDVLRLRGLLAVSPQRACVDLMRRLPLLDAVAVADAVRARASG